jgi:hypothetical protein
VVIVVLLELLTDRLAEPSLTAGPLPKSWPEITSWSWRLSTVTCVITAWESSSARAAAGKTKAATAANHEKANRLNRGTFIFVLEKFRTNQFGFIKVTPILPAKVS